MEADRLLEYLAPRRDEMLADLVPLVAHESPSLDKVALDALADTLSARFEAVGCAVERLPNPVGGDHLRARFPGLDDGARPGLVLLHFDTVWPVGTTLRLPVRVEPDEDRAYGPGIYDMKASLVIAEHALKALRALDLQPARPVELLLTSDEEIGSPTSRPLIEAMARACEYALVMEAPLLGGRLKTARKAVGRFVVEARGRAAHSGVEPEKGVSAVDELARHVLAIHALADLEKGTTLNVGVVRGGTVSNTVAALATAEVDVRAATPEEADRVVAALNALRPHHPEATVALRGGMNRPAMVRTEAVAGLFERTRAIGRGLGLDLTEGSTGGASDGNFTAAAGVPTLDGLGARGAGAHADHEHILISSLTERAALLAAMLLHL